MKKLVYLLFVFPLLFNCGDNSVINQSPNAKKDKRASDTVSIDGVWVGKGNQFNQDGDWFIQLDIDGDNYSVQQTFPTKRFSDCDSKWELIKKEGNKIIFNEIMLTGECPDGKVELEIINENTVRLKWWYLDGKRGAFAELIKF